MCQDGKFINVAVGSERIWERFREAMELEELGKPEYATNGDRVTHRSVLVPYLQQVFLTKPVATWVQALQEVSVPSGPINDLADVFADPQIEARAMLQEMIHPTVGRIKQTGIPVKFSLTPGGLDLPPPLLGQHNDEILASMGYGESDIKSLRERDVI
jgi:formyl-CoA transferase